MYMHVVLQHIRNSASPVYSETVLDPDRWVPETANFEAVFGIVAIDCSFSEPLDFLVSHTTVDHVHLISHMYLRMINKFEYSNSKRMHSYIYLHFDFDYFY